jgi:EpsD family peptidyl-prolyl cis-trans isomerase
MKSSMVRLLAPVALIALLGGCNLFNKGQPKGQVVATVNGQEVTLAELQAEMGSNTPSNPAAAKAVEQAALQRIIARDLLAQAAHDQKLDQTPQFAIELNRGRKELQASLLEKKMASEVPPPQRDEADRFVADNPSMFAQRQLFVLDQVQAPPSTDASLLRQLEPLKDLGAVEALLNSRSVPHQRGINVVDSLRVDPKLTQSLQAANATNDLLIVNLPNMLTANAIKETHAAPITGDAATRVAMQILANRRTQDAVQKQAQSIIAAGTTKVKYNDAYKPTAQPAAAPAAAAPASGAPAAAPASAPVQLPAPGSSTGQPFALGK